MREAFICDAARTAVGRYGGALASVRPDDLLALVIRALLERNGNIVPEAINDVIAGCANQAGEDNRNVARMSLLIAGMPVTVPGVTINRLCGSGMDAVAIAARAVMTGDSDLIIAGGVESMSRAPFVISKSQSPYSRAVGMYDTTLGWRFPNSSMEKLYGIESMAETAENIATDYEIGREDQDLFALCSQEKTAHAISGGLTEREIVPVTIPVRKGDPVVVKVDEHPRSTSLEKLAALRPVTGDKGTITAGNASGINDGAAALIVASPDAAGRYGLTPLIRVVGTAVSGVHPRVMGMGPVPATNMLLDRFGKSLDDIDIIELNEAFAAQALGCIRALGLEDDDSRINRLGGAIALGHPLGMSGARLITTCFHQMKHDERLKTALATMCIGVGQGISMLLERA